MARPTGFIAAAAILGLTVSAVSAQTPGPRPVLSTVPQFQQAKLSVGGIRGTVLDDHGAPVSDALVSALSPLSSRMVTTDVRGHFRFDALPSGDYVLRIHRNGFMTTRRDGVRVSASGAPADVEAIHLRRDAMSPAARPILAAGMDAPSDGDAPSTDGDNHTETAWRLRHLKRGVLKQDGDVVNVADAAGEEPLPSPAGSLFGRAFDGAASFLTATPFSGEVNLLTTSALRDGSIVPLDFMPHGVAYLSIGAPAASGRWDVRASLNQSDLSAWILAGSYTSRDTSPHAYNFGTSYAMQQYQNPRARLIPALPGAPEPDARSVGELYGGDHWTISPLIAVDYGARYAHYDYLTDRSLFSPRVGFSVTPYADTHLSAHVDQRMLAPGAEEFVAPATAGPWLPPERTFEAVPDTDLRAERIRTLDIGVDHEFDGAFIVGVHRIQQRVDDQLVTLFGLPVAGDPASAAHYLVANGGAVDAEGWVFSLSTSPSQRVHGSIDYTVTRADWLSRGDVAAISLWAPSAVRPRTEDVQNLTTSLQTVVPQTATRVFVVYTVNAAFAHNDDPTRPALDYRFDVQVNQALPFMPFSRTARWEVLVGMRNLFRDPSEPGSMYDELLVVRPPKRVVGGVLVRF
jgi:Carboxypeptidase regulatory-like domain/TonB dependent receptor